MKYQNYMQVDPKTGEKSYGAVPMGDPIPEDAWPVDAQPSGDFEAHCPYTNAVVCDDAAKADFDAGKEHIDAAHIWKAIEARLILAGYAFDGMIRAEAIALGTEETLLAKQIAGKSQPLIEREISRRVVKEGAKNG